MLCFQQILEENQVFISCFFIFCYIRRSFILKESTAWACVDMLSFVLTSVGRLEGVGGMLMQRTRQ